MIRITGDVIYFDGDAVGIVTVRPGSLRDRLETTLDEFDRFNDDIDEAITARLDRLNKALMNTIANAELTSR